MPEYPELLTLPEAAKVLRISLRTLGVLISQGKIKPTPVSAQRTVVRRTELLRYLEACDDVAADMPT